MDEQEFQEQTVLLLMAMEAVTSALAKRASADPAFSLQVTAEIIETTAGMEADVAARVNAIARKITGEK